MSKPGDKSKIGKPIQHQAADYDSVLSGVVELLDVARRASARVVNTLMTAPYWEIGRRIVEHEQAGQKRADYGEKVVIKYSKDLTHRFGRGFGAAQVAAMRQFHLTFPLPDNFQSVIGKSSAGAVGLWLDGLNDCACQFLFHKFTPQTLFNMPKSVQNIIIAPTIGGTGEHHAWLLEATNEQLDEYISLTSGNETLNRMALAERDKRHFKQLSKPHWTMTPGFIVGFLAMVFAAIAAWPTIRAWIQSSLHENKAASSQSPQSHSVSVTPPEKQKSSPATNAAPNINLLNK